MSPTSEDLFLITYHRDGLMHRDSWFHQPDDARRHVAYLQDLFPEARVQLHVIPVGVQPPPAPDLWQYLEF